MFFVFPKAFSDLYKLVSISDGPKIYQSTLLVLLNLFSSLGELVTFASLYILVPLLLGNSSQFKGISTFWVRFNFDTNSKAYLIGFSIFFPIDRCSHNCSSYFHCTCQWSICCESWLNY